MICGIDQLDPLTLRLQTQARSFTTYSFNSGSSYAPCAEDAVASQNSQPGRSTAKPRPHKPRRNNPFRYQHCRN